MLQQVKNCSREKKVEAREKVSEFYFESRKMDILKKRQGEFN